VCGQQQGERGIRNGSGESHGRSWDR
jgi:hypothetical protein